MISRNFFGMRSLDEISLIRSGPFPYSFARLASALSPYLAFIYSILYISYQLSRVVYGGGKGRSSEEVRMNLKLKRKTGAHRAPLQLLDPLLPAEDSEHVGVVV